MSPTIEKTLHELGNGIYAYTQLPGSWGWSNAGLITDAGESLLVDTLFDLHITHDMLAEMRRAVPSARRIGTVVNTHGNGDHCYGNALVAEAEIIGTRGCVDDLRESPASRIHLLLRAGALVQRFGTAGRGLARGLSALGIDKITHLLDATELAVPAFSDFDFSEIEPTLPNRVFAGELDLYVGDKPVKVIELGPAHTRGDAVVFSATDKTVFTGDLLFHGSHPIVWEGPVSSWIAALERLLDMDIETVVPGHGPITDKNGLREGLRYLQVLSDEVRRRFDAGMSFDDALRDITLDEFRDWPEAERLYVNVQTLYRDFSGEGDQPDVLAAFAGMARLGRG